MPTPNGGSISVRDLEKEFGVVDGTPSAIGEYTGRTGSFAGTSLGVEGVSTVGEIAFSELRGRTAHASPELIIDTLYKTFGTKNRQEYIKVEDGTLLSNTFTWDPILQSYYKSLGQKHSKFLTGTTLPWESGLRKGFSERSRGIISPGNGFTIFPFAILNSTINTNIPSSHQSPYGSFSMAEDVTVDGVSTRKPSSDIDENVHACLNNTLIYLATGKCKNIGDYGTGTSGTTPVTSRLRIGGFKFNGQSVNPQDESIPLTWGTDHGTGAGGGKYNSFGRTVKTCMAVYNTGNVKLSDCKNAQFSAGGAFWNGNLGSKDTDTLYQKLMLLLPNRWERVSSSQFGAGTGQMTLNPGEIAIVTTASNTPIQRGDQVVGWARTWFPKGVNASLLLTRGWKLSTTLSRIGIRGRNRFTPTQIRVISREEFMSSYGSFLTLENLPTRFQYEPVSGDFGFFTNFSLSRNSSSSLRAALRAAQRVKRKKFTTLNEALDSMFKNYDYYEYDTQRENNLTNILWSPILNRTMETDRFITPMFYSTMAWFGMTVIAVYANYFNKTITCDLSMPGFVPYVSIFRFAGDGYMTSRKQVAYPESG